jgi:hypothetical protein
MHASDTHWHLVVLSVLHGKIKFDETPSVDCYRSIAERFPQLVGGVSCKYDKR